jgi:hypothetical protein
MFTGEGSGCGEVPETHLRIPLSDCLHVGNNQFGLPLPDCRAPVADISRCLSLPPLLGPAPSMRVEETLA